jgi:hypothetical protein
VEDTAFYSLPPGGPAVPETFAHDHRADVRSPPVERQRQNTPKATAIYSAELPPAFPVFICEVASSPVKEMSQSPTLPDEVALPCRLDVLHEIALLNGGGNQQVLVESSLPQRPGDVSSSVEQSVPSEPQGSFDRAILSELLELHNARVPVVWPQGLDALSVRVILSQT